MDIAHFPQDWIVPLAIVVWAIASFKSTLLFSYYWQLKEYRWDRMGEFLRSQKGKSLLLSPFSVVKLLLLTVFVYDFFYPRSGEKFSELLVVALLLLGVTTLARLAHNFFKHSFFRPKLTLRMALILGAIFLLEAGAIIYFPNQALTVIALEIIRPIFVTVIVHLVGIPFLILKKYLMRQATKKREQLKDLKVIGITGSYGKSSTKEFLDQILQQKFKVAKTSQHVNVDIGIAQTILNNVDASHEVFIVEMGAYKKGEIASSCRIAKPQIGILTGINEQHLSFFGSLETTIEAKGELLASLPSNGLAIVNADNINAIKALRHNQAKHVIRYSMYTQPDLYATDVEQKDSSLQFKVHYQDQEVLFEVNLFGEHFVQNLLACIACALELGLSLPEIAQYAKSCQVLEGSLQIFTSKSGAKSGIKIINDSYNANPDGFISALNSLQSLRAKRNFLVTPGMLELGAKSEELHQRVGEKLAEVCDVIFVTSTDAFEILEQAIKKTSPDKEVYLIQDYQELTQKITEKIKAGDAILFENRVPNSVIEQLKNL